MRFTAEQYDAAIKALQDAKSQLEPDGRCCVVCGDSGHQAFECGWNPLVAVAICRTITKQADDLHETLHTLAGYDTCMGEQVGPARVKEPVAEESHGR